MRSSVKLFLATAALCGASIASTSASAQYYYHAPQYVQPHARHYQYQPYVYQPYGYVDPRIARKQAQLQRRFVEKYGYGYGHNHGYAAPQYHGNVYGHHYWGHRAYPNQGLPHAGSSPGDR